MNVNRHVHFLLKCPCKCHMPISTCHFQFLPCQLCFFFTSRPTRQILNCGCLLTCTFLCVCKFVCVRCHKLAKTLSKIHIVTNQLRKTRPLQGEVEPLDVPHYHVKSNKEPSNMILTKDKPQATKCPEYVDVTLMYISNFACSMRIHSYALEFN